MIPLETSTLLGIPRGGWVPIRIQEVKTFFSSNTIPQEADSGHSSLDPTPMMLHSTSQPIPQETPTSLATPEALLTATPMPGNWI